MRLPCLLPCVLLTQLVQLVISTEVLRPRGVPLSSKSACFDYVANDELSFRGRSLRRTSVCFGRCVTLNAKIALTGVPFCR